VLAELTAGAVADAAHREDALPLSILEGLALSAPAVVDSYAALEPSENIKVIAEVKRASPSRGDLAPITDPAALATLYQTGGASAISVLTEERKFLGCLDDLRAVRAAVSVPVLRKDFIATPYQLWEARAAGADMVLLIVAALQPATLASLFKLATELGMGVLVETHSVDEVERAVDLGSQIIGVNARDLTTFELDRDLFASVVHRIPAGTIRIAESAVRDASDVAHYRSAGADVVLVGEALVTGDPLVTLSNFLAVS
jgi:indole-3-glycerol phosphate synthase